MINDLTKRLLEHADWCDANEWGIPITLGDDLRAAAERIEALTAENAARWISVEERLPKTEEDFLCAFDDGFIATASWIDGDWELWADAGQVTHWMPLPKPPTPEE